MSAQVEERSAPTPLRPTIMVTQSEGAEGSMAQALEVRGARVLAVPAIRIAPPEDWGPLDAALARIDAFDWIVFTSRHAVEAVTGRPSWAEARSRAAAHLRVAAVGRATAKVLARMGIEAEVVPESAGAAGLAHALAAQFGLLDDCARSASHVGDPEPAAPPVSRATDRRPPDQPSNGPREPGTTIPPMDRAADRPAPIRSSVGQPAGRSAAPPGRLRVFWPRSDIARHELPEALSRLGADIADPIAYRTVRPEGTEDDSIARRLEAGEIGAVTFLSPSSARNLAALLGWSDLAPLGRRTVVASIGPSTSEALRELGVAPRVESAERTAEDLAATLLAYLEAHPASRGPDR